MTRRPIISLMLCLLLWRLAVVTTACPPPECPDCYYPEGDTCKYICTDCVAPTAGFTVWPATDNRYVCIDDAVTFSAWAHSDDPDGCLDSYSWTFGVDAYDISGDDGSWESCRYSTVGDKTVELTVWDDDCSCCCAYDSDCCADNPDCYDKSDTFNRTVTVVEVASLLPDTGTEFDDGDGDSNTKSFAVCVGTGVVTVTATPDPNVSEENLPGYGYTWGWTLEGGTGTSLLSRTVDKTTAGVTTITCTCGSSSKTTKIYVVELKSETVATVPDDRSRTLLGIGEEVNCWVDPSMTMFWSLTGDGGTLDVDGEEVTQGIFTAVKSNDTPKYATVKAELPGTGLEWTLEFTIIKPTGEINVFVYDEDKAELGPPDLYMSHSHVFEAFVQPTTVSFYNVAFQENAPVTEWEWPDGTDESFGPKINGFTVGYNNMWGDGCIGYDHPVSRLGNPPVDFEILLSVPEEFQDDGGNWWAFLPDGSHKHEYRASDYKSKGTILDDNVPSGQGWMGPYKTKWKE